MCRGIDEEPQTPPSDPIIDLCGEWSATPTTPELATDPTSRSASADWSTLTVPGHWRTSPAFADHEGPVLYRRAFEYDPPTGDDEADTRYWLVADGVFYTSDIWLDDTYVGDTEGYFFPHSFEVTEQMRARREHLVAFDVGCAPQHDRRAKRNLTGVFQHWDCIDPDWNPGGIWRPVRLERSGPVRIRHHRVLCRRATEHTSVLTLRAVLDAATAGPVALRTHVTPIAGATHAFDGHEHIEHRTLAAGENRVEWTVTVPDGPLWWPRALGRPTLLDVTCAVETALGETVSDVRRRRVGLRSARLRNWVLHVNGERLFLKGANVAPTRMALGEATADAVTADVHHALEAGLDMVRVHGHITRPEFYDAADRHGVLVFQDLPLQWGYARSVRRQARRQAREAVDLLGHHPSIVQWCGHNEPLALDIDAPTLVDPARARSLVVRGAVAQLAPSWNKTILDRSIRRVLRRNDPSRTTVAHSGVLPHPPLLDGTDSHLYFGWYHGDTPDLARFLRIWPRMARFVSEFGAQAVPTTAGFCRPERWPDLDWDTLGRRHGLQRARFDRYVPPTDHTDFASWRDATQRYQAMLLKHQVEALRRLKYRPTGGFAMFLLADAHPAVSWAVLDHDRVPKAGYDALRRACAPVIVTADPPAPTVPGGALLERMVHVVSDRRDALDDLRIDATVTFTPDGAPPHAPSRSGWAGSCAADACAYVGRIATQVPDVAGVLRLELSLTGDDVEATNTYESTVHPTAR